jgi:hypothetical protein
VIYQIVNMLVYFEPAALCDMHTGLILAPLPAKKQLWEANDDFEWRLENEREFGVQHDFGLAVNGDLVELDESQLFCNRSPLRHKPSGAGTAPRSSENWEEWCSGMDGLGGLIMLAAALIA